MKIKSLTLKKYTRLELSGIELISAVFTQRMILVLGSNGSGKSSIIQELSPLPADHQDYARGGYKIIEIEHNGSDYVLTSSFIDEKPKYTFMKDSENLNSGLTATVYKQLVLSEFGITEEIHSVMTGVTTLDRMGIAQRRQWFTKIPGVDYEYAINYYKRLKERTKFLQTNLKELNSRLVKEKTKVVSEEEQTALLERAKSLDGDLHRFLTLKSNKLIPVYNKSNLVALRSTADSLLSGHEWLYDAVGDIDAVEENRLRSELLAFDKEIVVLDTQLAQLATALNEKNHEQDQLSALNDGSTKTSSQRIEAIEAEKAIIKAKLFDVTIENRYGYYQNGDLPVRVEPLMADLTNNNSLFEYLASEVEADPDLIFNIRTLEQYREEKHTLEQYVTNLGVTLTELASDIRHMEKHKEGGDTVCPNCNHTWIKGFNAKRHESNLTKHNQLSLSRDGFCKRIEALELGIEHINIQLGVRARWDMYKSNRLTLCPFLQDVERIINSTPGAINKIVSCNIHDLQLLGEMYKLDEKISVIKRDADLYNRDNGALYDRVHIEIENISWQFEHKTARRTYCYDTKGYIIGVLEQLVDLKKANESLVLFQSRMDDEKRKAGMSLMDAYVNECIAYLKFEISVAQEQVMNNTIRLNVISSLEEEIRSIEMKHELLQKACDNLSPTTGLIAKGLSSFLESFLGDMNTFIASVWTYPLEMVVERIEDEELDLDFKFKVKANDKPSSPDVAKTSSGQKEIIDLAFRIVSTIYLGLKDWPLYLDEFGVKLDHHHRNRIMQAIDNIMLRSANRQVFMVSHYSSAYSSMNNCQVIMLHHANIVIPAEMQANEDIDIEYTKGL